MINISDFATYAKYISAYADEHYTDAVRINSTGIVGDNPDVVADGESFVGQLRWYKTITPTWNVPSFTDATDGDYTDISTTTATYIKTFHAIGVQQHNLQNLITNEDGLEKFARDQAILRANHEHEAVLNTLKGVAAAEAAYTGGGITGFDVMPSSTVGMYVDINAAGAFGAAATGTSDARKLFSADDIGAARGERLFRALGMGFKDYEDDWMYLLTSPETMAEFRAANLIEQDRVVDGNLEFDTIFGGKFRLIQTRASQGNFASLAGINDQSTKTTFLVKPGSIVFKPFDADTPFEIDRDPAKYRGSGVTKIWHRFGYIAHPQGYSWAGADNTWATHTTLAAGASWTRRWDPLNLGIFPIFHS